MRDRPDYAEGLIPRPLGRGVGSFHIAGIGLLSLKRWVIRMNMLILVSAFPSYLYVQIIGVPMYVSFPLIGVLILSMVVLYYLTRPNVREQFKNYPGLAWRVHVTNGLI